MGAFRNVVAAAAVIAATLGAAAGVASAQATVGRGAVVALRGTPHIWVGDDEGVLHWAGDTRALSGRFVDWGSRRETDVAGLGQFRRGSPWLSAGLLKSGDPIYLVKWETSEAVPTLFHIQSIRDVELFGITGDNYGDFVRDAASWDARFGLTSASLGRAVLVSATGPVAPTPLPTATPLPALAAFSEALRLNRNPRFQADGDLYVTVPSAWTEGFDFTDSRDANVEAMFAGERLRAWRATETDLPSPVYALITATTLDYHKEVRTADAFARKALASYCRTSLNGQCTQQSAPQVVTFAGQSALRYETRSVIEYTATDGVGRRHEWSAYHYFFIRGNWAYEFRVFGETPETFAARAQPVVDVLVGTRFF